MWISDVIGDVIIDVIIDDVIGDVIIDVIIDVISVVISGSGCVGLRQWGWIGDRWFMTGRQSIDVLQDARLLAHRLWNKLFLSLHYIHCINKMHPQLLYRIYTHHATLLPFIMA